MTIRFVLIAVLWFLADLYFFQAVRTVSRCKWVWLAYWIFEFIAAAVFVYFILTARTSYSASKIIHWALGLAVLSLLPKLITLPILISEDLVRLGEGIFRVSKGDEFWAGRRKFISQLTLGAAAIPFLSVLHGIWKGKYDYQVHTLTLKFPNLPEAFHGFSITQLSDIHSGSLDDKKAVEKGVAMANKLGADVLLFTGDLVNNRADEMNDWKEIFSKLTAPKGKFSVLGNHDYGDYVHWNSAKEKANNFQQLADTHAEIGFKLLRDEAVTIEKDGQQISLIGVENWGKRFHQYGNLNKALEKTAPEDFKILMSHDPSHWEAQVLPCRQHIDLTLSGHTHGMQLGIEVGRMKWSPSKYLYPQWAGLYNQGNRCLYVNRGFGFIGFPGRVGILPEITFIRLEKV